MLIVCVSISQKVIATKYLDSIIMLRFVQIKVAKGEFYGAKNLLKLWNIDVDNIVISKLVKTKNNSKYLAECLDELLRPLVLILPKMSGYVNAFNDNDEDKNKNNKLMS